MLKETSDCKEALPIVVVWRSAITTSGAQSVMMRGMKMMPKLSADSWGSPMSMQKFSFFKMSPMVLVRSGWTKSGALELSRDSLTAMLIHLGFMTAVILKMQE